MKKTPYEEWNELLDSNNNNKNINTNQYSGVSLGSAIMVSGSSLSLGWGKWKGMIGSGII